MIGVGIRGVALAVRNLFAGASLDLRFAGAEVLDPRVTFTRASNATRINSAGVLELVSTNGPRFDYDPVTLQPRGLLIEEQRTNLLLQSLIDGTPLATQAIVLTSQAYTLSFYGTGTVTISGMHSAVVDGLGAYPSRKTYTFTVLSGAVTFTVTGDVKYAQVEAGSFATSYIPTAASAATRAADVAVMTGANFSNWYNQSEGTLFANVSSSAPTVSGTSRRIANVNNGTENNRITIGWAGLTGVAAAFVTDGGVAQAAFNSPSGAYPFPTKVAIAYKTNDICAAVNSSSFATDISGNIPVVDRMTIGDVVTGGTGPQNINGHIRRIAYWPRRLTNAELQGVTA